MFNVIKKLSFDNGTKMKGQQKSAKELGESAKKLHNHWIEGEEADRMRENFREIVQDRDAKAIATFLESIYENITAEQVETLTTLVMDRDTPEPTKEALLIVISLGSRPLVEIIISLLDDFPFEERNGCRNSKIFQPHITPLLLACTCNNFAIVECLLLRGHEIVLPHRLDCVCEECGRKSNNLASGLIILDTYRAISSDAFLWLATYDPLLSACNLAHDLEICQQFDKQFKEIYAQLHRNVVAFSTRLMQQCWNMEEVDILLGKEDGSALAECELQFPRVRMALDSHMKNFVATLNVQTELLGRWYGRWGDYGENALIDLGRSLRHTLLYPFTATIHTFSGGALMDSYNYPLARYLSRLSSYIVFLLVLVLLRFQTKGEQQAYQRSLTRSGSAVFLEFYVYMYAYGMVVSHYFDFLSRGLNKFYELWWRWFDLILLWLFSGAFFCWIMNIATVWQDGISKLHRRHWVSYDFALLYDIYLGTASIMAFWRIFYFLQLHRSVGSTVISIGRCVREVIIFILIMIVMMLCFSLGVTTIYQSYSNNKARTEDGGIVKMKGSFTDIFVTLRNLYWSFYGYLAPWDYTLVVGNAGPDQKVMMHDVTMVAGEFVIAIYHIALVITLLNLMVSLLVRTADQVLKNEDTEWKYTRCHIFYEYFEWFSAVPPPLNIIFLFTNGLRRVLSGKYKFVLPDLWAPKKYIEMSEKESEQTEIVYWKLLRTLFDRYRNSYEYSFISALKIDTDLGTSGGEAYYQTPNAIFDYMNAVKNQE